MIRVGCPPRSTGHRSPPPCSRRPPLPTSVLLGWLLMVVPARTNGSVIVSWLGAQPPASIVAALTRVAQVGIGWRQDADLVVIWAASGLELLSVVPSSGPRPAVLIAFEREPSADERRSWARAAVGEIVLADRLAELIVERWGGTPAGAAPASPSNKVQMSAAASGLSSASLATPRDAFPPLRMPFPSGGPPPGVASYVESLQRYIQLRDAFSAEHGAQGLGQLMELFHLREQVPPTSARRLVAFGQTFGSVEQQLGWPLLLRRGPSRKRQGNDVLRGSVFGVGTDGLIVDLDFQAAPRQKLVGDLPVDLTQNAQLLFEARWQRRVAASRWHLGLLILEMRLRPLDP